MCKKGEFGHVDGEVVELDRCELEVIVTNRTKQVESTRGTSLCQDSLFDFNLNLNLNFIPVFSNNLIYICKCIY